MAPLVKMAEREGLLEPPAFAPAGPPSLRSGVQHGFAVLSNPAYELPRVRILLH